MSSHSCKVVQLTLVYLLVTLVTLAEGEGCEQYRQFTGHTMCIYKPNDCSGKKILKQGFNQTQKDDIVTHHNLLRMAMDKWDLMSNLTWDDELATIAQRLSDQCLFQHDEMRRVERFNVGQNIFISSKYPVEENLEPDGCAATSFWFDEVVSPKFNPANIAPIAAHQTLFVGCGYTMYEDPLEWSHKLYVCNYGPTGSVASGTLWFGRGLSALTATDDNLTDENKNNKI